MEHSLSKVGGICIRRFFLAVLAAGLAACGEVVDRSYCLVLPDLPPAWQMILGSAHWSVEWIDDAGIVQMLELPPAELPPYRDFFVTVVNDASSPILAYPYWPERGLKSGEMKPAGAIFPWDAHGGHITLSWQGGVDAVFWRGLSRADNDKRTAVSFNWRRWREAWNDGSFPPAAVLDPWLCDWESITAKIAASGFDKRRIVVMNNPRLALSGETWQGAWYGPSPFDVGIIVAPGESLSLPFVPPTMVAFGSMGLVRYSDAGFLLFPWTE